MINYNKNMATNKDTEIFESWEDIEDTTVRNYELYIKFLFINKSNQPMLIINLILIDM